MRRQPAVTALRSQRAASRRTRLQNPEIRKLCETIISGQQAEIEQMKALLQKGG